MFGTCLTRPETEVGAEMFRSSTKTDGDVQHGPQGCSNPGASRPPCPGVHVSAEKLFLDARFWIFQSHLYRWPTLWKGD